jgi:hypothetical protein
MIALRLLTLWFILAGVLLTPARADDEPVAVWGIKFKLNSAYSQVGGHLLHEYKPLEMEFGVSKTREYISKGAYVYFRYINVWEIPPARHEADVSQAGAPTKVTVQVSRRIESCDPELNVRDTNVDQPVGTLRISANAEALALMKFTTVVNGEKSMQRISGPFKVTSTFSVPYAFDTMKQSAENYEPNKGDDVSSGEILFDPMLRLAASGWTRVRRNVSYEITRKNASLKYAPVAEDMVDSKFVKRFKDYTRDRRVPFYAHDPHNGLVHGNSRVTPWLDGMDVTDKFGTHRDYRTFAAPLNTADERPGAYTAEPFSADTRSNDPVWDDVPGALFTLPAQRWARQRLVEEFLIAVTGFPEFGFLYAHVVIDTAPRQYRVRMYAAERITEQQWCEIKRLRRPYRDESAAAVIDSQWQSVP